MKLPDFPVPTRFVAIALAIASVVGAYFMAGMGMALMTLSAVTMLAGIGLLWSSVQSLTGEANLSLDEALSFAAPSAEEERKRAVLRALKDLEFERSVGKISQDDYDELSSRYRAEAKELLRALEAEQKPDIEKAEELFKKRLDQVDFKAEELEDDEEEPAEEERDEPDGAVVEEDDILTEKPGEVETDEDEDLAIVTRAPSTTAPTRRCRECETRNDLDAHFCKKCGKPMASEEQQLCHACPAVFDDDLDTCPQCGVAVEDA